MLYIDERCVDTTAVLDVRWFIIRVCTCEVLSVF